MPVKPLRSLGLSALLGIFCLAAGAPANAGTIFASGDFTPSFSVNTIPSNGVFFENILQGGTSVVTHDLRNSTFQTNLDTFYNGLSGVSSTDIGNAAITSAVLGGVDLFITHMSTDGLSASEIPVLSDFLLNDGTLMIMADSGAAFGTRLDDALTALGSGMSVLNIGTSYDSGIQDATGANIASDPFTTGVTSLRWGSTHEISGGTPLFFMNTQDRVFMAYESTATPVPEPPLVGLVILGLLGAGFARRRRGH